MTLTQVGLIDDILNDLGFLPNGTYPSHEQVKMHSTLMEEVLHPCPNANPYPLNKCSYCLIVGKLNFLVQSTHPDITYAINMCTCYLNNPNLMHYQAVKCIGHYLYGTCDKGLILTPTNENQLCAYIDSDFAGSWLKHTSHLHQSALSCASFVITYSGCPIHWVSKLESKIALSTCKAEYITLSMCA